MQKKEFWKYVAIITIFSCLFMNWGNIAIADNGEAATEIVSSGETPLIPIDQGDDGSANVMPLDITYGTPTWCVLQTSATVYYAPYGSGCASTGYTLSAGTGVFVQGREYDYFYIYWYIGDKEMYGYVPMSAINLSNYTWTEYDIYRPGKCSGTTPVISYAGTVNTYIKVGEIYKDEYPLLILGKQVNPFNHVTYYFIQYQISSGHVKRGWVDSSLGTVTIDFNISHPLFNVTGPFCFVNRSTGKALTWNKSGNTVVQKTKNGSLEQFFVFEKMANVSSQPGYGYYRILSADNPSMALTVSGFGYAEGLSMIMAPKTDIDKRQEFLINTEFLENRIFYSGIFTRSTGEYRAVEVYGGYLEENTKIIQSQYVSGSNQQWEILRVTPHWNGTYGQYSGSASPVNRKVHYHSSLEDYISINVIRECVNRWNSVYNLSLEVIEDGSAYANNCLATLVASDLSSLSVDGYCSPVKRSSSNILTDYPFLESQNYVNDQWFSTKIHLDFNKLSNCTAEVVKGLICHELGHALKMSHTYMRLENPGSGTNWKTIDTSVSMMTSTISFAGTTTPIGVEIDQYRLKQKWDNIV